MTTRSSSSSVPLWMALVGVVAGAAHGCAVERRRVRVLEPLQPLARDQGTHVCPIITAAILSHENGFEAGALRALPYLPVSAFLVSARGYLFLIDAGLVPEPVRATGSPLSDAVLAYDMHHAATVVAQLGQAGITATDLAFVVLTHAHLDHAGELESLRGVPIVMSAEEARFALGVTRAYSDLYNWRSADGWTAMADRIRTVAWRKSDVTPFDRSFDVFGDGQVVLLPTPGHTPGSLSVLVRGAAGGDVLLVGDAGVSATAVRTNVAKGVVGGLLDEDAAIAAQSLSLLHALSASSGIRRIYASHDADIIAHRFEFLRCARSALRSARAH